MRMKMPIKALAACLLVFLAAAGSEAAESGGSILHQELVKARYDWDFAAASDESMTGDEADLPLSAFAQTERTAVKYKSPAKAFLYSLILPGAGQLYYGSKIKPIFFVGVEAFAWSQALKYDGNGDDLTNEYETFNRTHWLRDRYDTFLIGNYGTTRPDTLPDSVDGYPFKEIIEVLPETEVQQYFEMTGKYDQFAWGWDDAELDGAVWDDYVALDTVPRKVITTSDVPTSENREIYEGMRNAANDEYSKSMRFIFGIMANHLVSAFEAYFVTKSRNNAMRYEQEFAARWDIDAGLRSYHTTSDTPYLTVGYKF